MLSEIRCHSFRQNVRHELKKMELISKNLNTRYSYKAIDRSTYLASTISIPVSHFIEAILQSDFFQLWKHLILIILFHSKGNAVIKLWCYCKCIFLTIECKIHSVNWPISLLMIHMYFLVIYYCLNVFCWCKEYVN